MDFLKFLLQKFKNWVGDNIMFIDFINCGIVSFMLWLCYYIIRATLILLPLNQESQTSSITVGKLIFPRPSEPGYWLGVLFMLLGFGFILLEYYIEYKIDQDN